MVERDKGRRCMMIGGSWLEGDGRDSLPFSSPLLTHTVRVNAHEAWNS